MRTERRRNKEINSLYCQCFSSPAASGVRLCHYDQRARRDAILLQGAYFLNDLLRRSLALEQRGVGFEDLLGLGGVFSHQLHPEAAHSGLQELRQAGGG